MLFAISVLGCGASKGGTTGDNTTGTGVEGSSGVPTGSSGPDATSTQPGTTADVTDATSTTSTGTTGTDSGDTCGSLCESTGAPGPVSCNVFAPQCPEGEKCVWYAEDGGGAWNHTKCVPVTGDAQPGEPCTAQESAVSGVDDCAEGAMCWDLDQDLQGVCVELCSGSANKPICSDPVDFRCETAGEVLKLCLPMCDLLLQNCPGDDLCVGTGSGAKCVPDLSGREGQVFDACQNYSTCDKGLTCGAPVSAVECDQNAAGCCVPYCDLDLPDPMCPGAGQECLDYIVMMGKNVDVGFCGLPL